MTLQSKGTVFLFAVLLLALGWTLGSAAGKRAMPDPGGLALTQRMEHLEHEAEAQQVRIARLERDLERWQHLVQAGGALEFQIGWVEHVVGSDGRPVLTGHIRGEPEGVSLDGAWIYLMTENGLVRTDSRTLADKAAQDQQADRKDPATFIFAEGVLLQVLQGDHR